MTKLGHVAIVEYGSATVVAAVTHFADGILAALLTVVYHKRTSVHQGREGYGGQSGKGITHKLRRGQTLLVVAKVLKNNMIKK